MLADPAYLRSVANLSDRADDDLLLPHLEVASLRLRRWVGEEAYQDAESASPADPTRAKALKLAEAHLAAAGLVPSLTTNYSGQGLVGGASLVEGQASYLTPKQAHELVTDHLHQAEQLARPYLASAGTACGRTVSPDHA